MPNAAAIQGWRAQVPDSFRFAIKVPRRISHLKRLRDCGCGARAAADRARGLGSVSRLAARAVAAACALRRGGARGLSRRAARRVRARRSSFATTPGTFRPCSTLLKSRNAALVQSESDEQVPAAAVDRGLGVSAAAPSRRTRRGDLERWLERIEAAGVTEAQVFFKHEDGATGPKLAAAAARSGQK